MIHTMRYFIDCEFNGFGGDLISLALVREDGKFLSLIFGCDNPVEWVQANVMPILYSGPKSHDEATIPLSAAPLQIAAFLFGDPNVHIIADWPDDLRYFCQSIMTGPGMMAPILGFSMQVIRTDAYPTDLEGAVQHNAYWDAMALRRKLGFG